MDVPWSDSRSEGLPEVRNQERVFPYRGLLGSTSSWAESPRRILMGTQESYEEPPTVGLRLSLVASTRVYRPGRISLPPDPPRSPILLNGCSTAYPTPERILPGSTNILTKTYLSKRGLSTRVGNLILQNSLRPAYTCDHSHLIPDHLRTRYFRLSALQTCERRTLTGNEA
jgi:hypothetical protein